MTERTGWEHHELEKEMNRSNMAQLLEMFKRETVKASDQAVLYVRIGDSLNDEAKKDMKETFDLLHEGREKIAMLIAERLTDVKRVEFEIRPKIDR